MTLVPATSRGGIGTLAEATTTVTSAQLKNLVAAPITLIPAPGAGKLAWVWFTSCVFHAGATPYTVVAASVFVGPLGGNAYFTFNAAAVFASAVDVYDTEPSGGNRDDFSNQANLATVLNNAGTDLAAGNGTLTLDLYYSILSA